MPYGSWINELPTGFFRLVHIPASRPAARGREALEDGDATPLAWRRPSGNVGD
jgi:hypothetical protein